MIATTRTYKTAAVLLALLFGVLLVQGVGAAGKVRYSPQSAEELATREGQMCKDGGGTPSYHYEMNEDGSVFSITETCHGGSFDDWECEFFEGPPTAYVCLITPGETEPSEHTTIGDGVLEEIEPTTTPVRGDLGGGTLDPTDSGPSRPIVRSGTFATTVQEDDDERP